MSAIKEEDSLEDAPVIVERTYGASINDVWKAITDFDQMKQWYMPALRAFEPKVGFETEFTVEHEGNKFPHIWKVTEAVPQKKIAYTWRFPGHPGESLATFELFAEGENTRLKLTHSGLETHDGR
ncbi:MAG TPA: SRPBCC domain-containing protein, partial [Candidatus Angelobacter sp.]|nr:SRPBCC domain-containing protein [Candidatus Angelobacter sp.]